MTTNTNTDSRTWREKLMDEAIPSLVAGGLGIGISSFVLGVDISMNIPIMGMQLPMWGAIGGIIATSNAVAYASHDWVLEKIPSIQSIATYENRLLAPVLGGLGTYALFRVGVSSDVSLINSALLGAGSSVAGKYLWDTYNQANNK